MALIVVLSVLGAALPSAGVVRVYRRARADERARVALVAERGGNVDGDWEHDFDNHFIGLHAPGSRLRIARRDVVLVILGLMCTAAATILGACPDA